MCMTLCVPLLIHLQGYMTQELMRAPLRAAGRWAWLTPRQGSGQVTCLVHRNPLVEPGFQLRGPVVPEGRAWEQWQGKVGSPCVPSTFRPEQGLRECYRCPRSCPDAPELLAAAAPGPHRSLQPPRAQSHHGMGSGMGRLETEWGAFGSSGPAYLACSLQGVGQTP